MSSLHRPKLRDYGVGKNLMEPGALMPEASYHARAQKEALGGMKVPPAHTTVEFKLPMNQGYRAVFSSAFPFAVAAPNGEVRLKSITGFTNHTYKTADTVPDKMAYPAWVLAKGWLDVEEFRSGKAFSAIGPIDVEGGAVGLRVTGSRVKFAADLRTALHKARRELTHGCLDKTTAIAGNILSPEGFIGLFTGQTDPMSVFSAQQATMVPFIPVPSAASGKFVPRSVSGRPTGLARSEGAYREYETEAG